MFFTRNPVGFSLCIKWRGIINVKQGNWRQLIEDSCQYLNIASCLLVFRCFTLHVVKLHYDWVQMQLPVSVQLPGSDVGGSWFSFRVFTPRLACWFCSLVWYLGQESGACSWCLLSSCVCWPAVRAAPAELKQSVMCACVHLNTTETSCVIWRDHLQLRDWWSFEGKLIPNCKYLNTGLKEGILSEVFLLSNMRYWMVYSQHMCH